MPTIYEYTILSQGHSSWGLLEGMRDHLQEFLNSSEVRQLQSQGWELWQTSVLNDKNGNNGFMLLFRRPLQGGLS